MYLAFTLWLAAVGLGYPFQLDYGEGIVLWFSQEIAHGHAIYKGIAGMPYASSNYPPVAMLLSAALMPVFGEGYASGRLLNILSALLVGALIYKMTKEEAQSRTAGLIAGVFFLANPYIYRWIPLFRVDLIGLGFTFAGIYASWEFERRRGKGWLVVALGCFLLAFYTKQSLFAAPVAMCMALWFKDRELALKFGSAFAVLAAAIFMVLDRMTSGGFAFGLVESNATMFIPEQLVALVINFVSAFPVFLAMAAWPVVGRYQKRRPGVLEWYALAASGAVVMAGRVGAWENYFFELIAIGCVFLGIAVARASKNWQTSVWRIGLPVLLLAQIALMWPDPGIAANLVAQDWTPNQQLKELLQRVDGPIISEDMGALATSGKSVAYYTFQYSMLAQSGKWDQNWELNGLRTGLFPLVILENGTREDVDHYRRFTREFLSTLDQYYSITRTMGKYRIYTPAPLEHAQKADFGDLIELIGWSAEPQVIKPGTLQLEIAYQSKQVMDRRYTLFVHLINGDNKKVAQNDHEPLDGNYPTTRWRTGEVVRDRFNLTIPANWQPERTWLWVGWYDTDSGERLTVSGGVDDALLLAALNPEEK